jgi:phosphopantothenoylcysteine decarboxylase/phosphopantothenate--cysteine ligase
VSDTGYSGGESWRLAGKRVILGVCGGIAAYKAVDVCRRLSDAGALVLPVLTEDATRFVGPLTFSALAAEPAVTSMFTLDGAGPGRQPVPHVSLGRRADAVIVVPATARLIGSYAAGISSDLLTATLLATRAPVLVCPAMHAEMWAHPAVQDNVALLRRRGVEVLEPAEGRLAGGDFGKGRLPPPEVIVSAVAALFAHPRTAVADPGTAVADPGTEVADPGTAGTPSAGPGLSGAGTGLRGVKVVVSAGGTREPLDPVRYIGNRSSGKQGYAIAAEMAAWGAEVTLVTASELPPPVVARVEHVETAAEMAAAVLGAAAGADVVVMAAAVADYRPATAAERKIKKSSSAFSVELVPTLDILAELGARHRRGQVLVGFAAETATGAELVDLGRAKLSGKGADLIVANDVSASGAGFDQEQSWAVIVSSESTEELGLVDKRAVATRLVEAVAVLLGADLLASGGPSAHEEGAER